MSKILKERGPSLTVGAQYIKDLSFENAHFLEHIQKPPTQPKTDVKFDVSATHIVENRTEVVLHLVGTVTNQNNPIYLLELSYAGLFILSDAPQELAQDILMIECPRILFPFVRALVTTVTQDSGFPPLYLAPAVDFGTIWQQKKEHKTGSDDL